MTQTPKLLITGITGFIGKELQKELLTKNAYQLFGLVRNEKQKQHLTRNTSQIVYLTLHDIQTQAHHFEMIINLAGENIAAKRWSSKRKQQLLDSRVTLTEQLHHALAEKPKQFISMSAIGIYGMDDVKIYDEDHTGKRGFAYSLCKAWEKSAQKFSSAKTNVSIVRLGVVLGRGGALQKMQPAFKYGLGGKIASGRQWFPWVHINDVVRLIVFLLENPQQQGVFNAVAPQLTNQAKFANTLAKTLGRPCFITTPRWLLLLLFGEMSSLLTTGVRVYPTRTLAEGFQFHYHNIEDTLLAIYRS